MARKSVVLDSYVTDSLMRDLVGHDRRPAAYLVYLYVWAGSKHRRPRTSYADVAADIGLSRRTVQTAVRHLERRKLIAVERAGATTTPSYAALLPWRRRTPKR